MLTPYDWQEGIGHRASFIEGRLVQGAPVLALSIDAGVVIFSYRRHARKIYEIYDQLVYAAIGQQSDIEALRISALEFAHQEGYNRSERDVTIRRVVTALSGPIKRAFADFSAPPFVVRSLFVEVCKSKEEDTFAILDYEGDFTIRRRWSYVAGTDEHADALKAGLTELYEANLTVEDAHKKLHELWDATFIVERPEGFEPEAAFIRRTGEFSNRMVMLTPEKD